MNALLWVLQVVLALHTLMGAVWKYSNSEQVVPSLAAMPHAGWVALGVIELVCAVALVLPALVKPLGKLAPLAAAFLVLEMLLFVGVHLASGTPANGQVVYWLVVAALAAFLSYGRWVKKPL